MRWTQGTLAVVASSVVGVAGVLSPAGWGTGCGDDAGSSDDTTVEVEVEVESETEVESESEVESETEVESESEVESETEVEVESETDVTTPPTTQSAIKHLVIIIQENHSFDSYFARYCTAAAGSNPTCTTGPACCERGPDADPTGALPQALDDLSNGSFDRNHEYDCNLDEINGGAMDRFVVGEVACARPTNFAYAAPDGPVAPYHTLAAAGALADRYFQPVVGASASNDMFFARAGFVFKDNSAGGTAIGASCGVFSANPQTFTDPTIGDLLNDAHVPWSFFAEGYQVMKDAVAANACPEAPADCPLGLPFYPCTYDPTDIPFGYYPTVRDAPEHMQDLADFEAAVAADALPSVSFVKFIGYRTEHPYLNTTISAGAAAVSDLVAAIQARPALAADTLVIVTWDEGGGFYDHVAPPPTNTSDNEPYGVRVATLALGTFVTPNTLSHVTLEHSSLVKFIEWNWLGGVTGQLGTRDTNVHNIGSLLDAAKTGVHVPAD